MPKLTVVFSYPDKATLEEAMKMFKEQGEAGAIPNFVACAPYDAIEVIDSICAENPEIEMYVPE